MSDAFCFHCQLPVTDPGRWQIEHNGRQYDVCCAGCRAVAQTIQDAGLSGYYRFRSEPAVTGRLERPANLPPWSVYDEPELQARYCVQAPSSGSIDTDTDALSSVSIAVDGLRCGACVWLIESALGAVPGVSDVRVNLASERIQVQYDSKTVRLSHVLKRLAELGYPGAPLETAQREQHAVLEGRRYLQRLFVAGLVMMQSMMFALPAYLAGDQLIEASYEQLFRWASAVLSVPVVFYSGLPYLENAWRNLQNRNVGMDVPIAFVILLAFGASMFSTFTASGEVYFDSIAMFIFLLTGARYIEWSVRRNASRAIRAIDISMPDMASLVTDEENLQSSTRVPAARLKVGNVIVVSEGDRIPVDGTVISGHSAVDQSIVSGESDPVNVGPGNFIPGGALLCGGQIGLRVDKVLNQSTYSVIQSMANRGLSEKPPLLQLADQFASRFVLALIVVAAAVFLYWYQVDPGRAAEIAIAVLVISCPCALSLATPAALTAATDSLLRDRVLIAKGHALPTLAKVTDVVFDKTGTLTKGELQLVGVTADDAISRDDAIAVAAQVLAQSGHPVARALKRACQALAGLPNSDPLIQILNRLSKTHRRWPGTTPRSVVSRVGYGFKVRMADEQGRWHEIMVGSADWCEISERLAGSWRRRSEDSQAELTEVFVAYRSTPPAGGQLPDRLIEQSEVGSARPAVVLARLTFSDVVRDEAAPLVTSLRQMDLSVHLLSGDRQSVVEDVGKTLGIEAISAQATPGSKVNYVKNLQRQGKVVLMVGDGLNDAPVLGIADVSVAIGSASQLAKTIADIVCMANRPDPVRLLLIKGRQTMWVIRQNLLWAAGYNLLAVPLAATGAVAPWQAAIGMACSSLIVVINATRLSGSSQETNTVPVAGRASLQFKPG
ncbi:MAG: heavy metal translocating P-type ATPase [Burkholderiaceae bacterium]